MPDKDVMLQIKAHEQTLPWSIVDMLIKQVDFDEITEIHALREALGVLVDGWRNLAGLYERAKLKGAQTTYIVPLRHAAAELDKVIKTLEQPRRAPLGQLQAPAHESAGLDEARHGFVPDGAGRVCAAVVERGNEVDGSVLEGCGRFASHPAHRLDGPTERPGLDDLIAEASAPLAFPGQASADEVTAYLRGDADDLPGPDPGPSTVRDLSDSEALTMLGASEADREINTFLVGEHGPEMVDASKFKPRSAREILVAALWDADHPGCAPETCGGSRLDPCVTVLKTGGKRHDGDDLGAFEPIRTAREILETSTLTLPTPPVPPVPLLGQPGNAGDSYAPTYVPPGGVPMTYVELMTPVPAATLPAHLSHSQVETLADCPTKYRATRIGRIEDRDGGADWPETLHEIPQWAFIGGGAFHAAVEKVERIWAQNPNDPFDVVTADEEAPRLWVEAFEAECQKIEATSPVPRARWRASKQGAEGETWWNANGPEMLRRYLAARPAEPTVMLSPAPSAGATAPNDAAIELERTVDVPTPYGAIEYRAILDRVTVRHEMLNDRPIGIVALVIRDYKTGATMPDSTSQLGEYAQVLRLLGMPPQTKILGTYFNARKGTWTPEVDLEAEGWTADWFTWLVSTGYADRLALTTGPTRARPSSYCGGCPVRWACPVKGVKTIASR